MLLCSRRRVAAKAFRLCTYVQPAESDEEGRPTRWPPSPHGQLGRQGAAPSEPELCIRLLKSGTIDSKPWFAALEAAAAAEALGADVRVRPFGLTAVRLDQCRRGLGAPAVMAAALAGGVYMGWSLGG